MDIWGGLIKEPFWWFWVLKQQADNQTFNRANSLSSQRESGLIKRLWYNMRWRNLVNVLNEHRLRLSPS